MTFTFEDIETYCSGEMNSEQQLAFEQQLAIDDQLRMQVEEFRFLQTTIDKHQQAEQTLPQLTNILAPHTQTHFRKAEQQRGGRVISMNRIVTALALAASIALIFFIALPGVSVNDYPVDAMSGAVTRGNETDLSKAAQLFNNQQYEEAATAFSQLKIAKPGNATIDYHLGISLLKTKKAADALPLFEALTKGESVYKEDANFFAAVCAYHLQQKEKAKEYAEAVKKESKFYKYAKAILKKIN
jgi:predicted Zn-dependent protease